MRKPRPLQSIALIAGLAAAVLCTLPAAAAAQDDLVITDSSITADDALTIGDELSYTVEIEHPVELDVEFTTPPDGSRWTELERRLDTSSSGDTTTTRATVDYAIYRPGPTSGPPVEFLIDGESVGLKAPRHEVHIARITDDDASISGPRSPWPVWSEHRVLLWYAAGAIGFGFLALIGALAIRRRRYGDSQSPEPPPHVTAFDALERLADDFPSTDDEFKPFYFRLSHILRRYLGDRFGFPGAELTTTELVDNLNCVDHPDLSVDDIAHWLRACDRVKFAGYIPGAEKTRQRLNRAFEFVELTIADPKAESEPSDEADKEESR